MQTRAVQIIFTLICLVVAAALQELLPSFGGTKPPVLAIFAIYTAFRPSRQWMPVAIAAGAFEDALNGSMTLCCTFFALIAATGVHFLRQLVSDLPAAGVGAGVAIVAAPVHELWLAIWSVLPPGCSVVVRFFASTLPAAVAGAAIFVVLPVAERIAGLAGTAPERRSR